MKKLSLLCLLVFCTALSGCSKKFGIVGNPGNSGDTYLGHSILSTGKTSPTQFKVVRIISVSVTITDDKTADQFKPQVLVTWNNLLSTLKAARESSSINDPGLIVPVALFPDGKLYESSITYSSPNYTCTATDGTDSITIVLTDM